METRSKICPRCGKLFTWCYAGRGKGKVFCTDCTDGRVRVNPGTGARTLGPVIREAVMQAEATMRFLTQAPSLVEAGLRNGWLTKPKSTTQ